MLRLLRSTHLTNPHTLLTTRTIRFSACFSTNPDNITPIDFDPEYEKPPTRRQYTPNETLDAKRARLVYQSRKRGILETDLLLSTFASKYLSSMSGTQMDEFDKLMDENDWSIYYWATGAKSVPTEFQDNSVLKILIEHSKNTDKKILRMPDLESSF
ncbi:succinate dehydrogenase assembly factor 2 [Nowakowskiella sp. JEL0078]|nr:succinate dehydrogenase assembly factor 2 [Nowakowskiella sp. JEL0078]